MENRYVLVVDDNPATRTLLTAILQREFEVETAIDGADAIEMLRTKKYGAVLLDLLMPNQDGFVVLEHLKTNSPATLAQVLVITAAIIGGHLERLRDYAICGIISKPFEVDSVINAVRQCVEGDGGSGGQFVSSSVMLLLADLLSRRLL